MALERMNINTEGPKLDLKLHLSPPRDHRTAVSSTADGSYVSGVVSLVNEAASLRFSSETAAGSMMLVGCPRCLMYVMLLDEDPKCPKCKSTVLLDFLHADKKRRLNKY